MSDVFPVLPDFAKSARYARDDYEKLYAESIENPDQFWGKISERLHWHKKPTKVQDVSFNVKDFHIRWFEDGELNVSENCLDRHLEKNGNKVIGVDELVADVAAGKNPPDGSVVIAIDDVIASVKVAELVQHHFPSVKIVARARNRQHAYQLRAMGIPMVRETFHSSLVLAEQSLVELGMPEAEAKETTRKFADFDQKMLESMYVHRNDQDKLIQTAKQSAEELESLFAADNAR